MALREPFLVKNFVAQSSVELKAETGKALLVKGLYLATTAGPGVILKIGRDTVGYFYAQDNLGNHLHLRSRPAVHVHDWITSGSALAGQTEFAGLMDAAGNEIAPAMIGGLQPSTLYKGVGHSARISLAEGNLLDLLRKHKIFKGYPVPEGETFRIEDEGGGYISGIIVYEEWDPEDISPEQENGPLANSYLYIAYGQPSADVSDGGDVKIAKSITPVEFPNFPFEDVVPARHTIDIFGIAAWTYIQYGADIANYIRTRFLKMIKGRRVLFSPDREGLLMLPVDHIDIPNMKNRGFGDGACGMGDNLDARPPLLFSVPIRFNPGDELNTFWTLEKGGAGVTIDARELRIALIAKVTKGETPAPPPPATPGEEAALGERPPVTPPAT